MVAHNYISVAVLGDEIGVEVGALLSDVRGVLLQAAALLPKLAAVAEHVGVPSMGGVVGGEISSLLSEARRY